MKKFNELSSHLFKSRGTREAADYLMIPEKHLINFIENPHALDPEEQKQIITNMFINVESNNKLFSSMATKMNILVSRLKNPGIYNILVPDDDSYDTIAKHLRTQDFKISYSKERIFGSEEFNKEIYDYTSISHIDKSKLDLLKTIGTKKPVILISHQPVDFASEVYLLPGISKGDLSLLLRVNPITRDLSNSLKEGLLAKSRYSLSKLLELIDKMTVNLVSEKPVDYNIFEHQTAGEFNDSNTTKLPTHIN